MTDRASPQDPLDPNARPFPSEAEWLTLALPPEAVHSGLPSPDFVVRVVAAVTEDARLDHDLAQAALGLPRELLKAHAPPPPSADFVARTLQALQDDRRSRWQRILAKHVAPAPSPFFVARTLAALRSDREESPPPRRWRPSRLAFLFAAAAAVVSFAIWPRIAPASLEERLAVATPAAFAHASSPSVLATLSVRDDASNRLVALPNVAADGLWLLRAEVR